MRLADELEVDPERPPCRFGCREPAVAVVHYPDGCHCWPDPVQALCLSHAMKGLQNNRGRVVARLGDDRLPDRPAEPADI